jgi:hypothetical protein
VALLRLQKLGVTGAMAVAVWSLVSPILASAEPQPTPGIEIDDDSGRCTAGFAAQGGDGSYYFLTSGHCDGGDRSAWTYGDDIPLGHITNSEKVGDERDAATVLLDPAVGIPGGNPGGRYPVRDVLDAAQLHLGMPFCKMGAVSGETCGEITDIDGEVIETTVYSLHGDSGSPGYVKNPDGTVSAVGILMASPDGDDYTTYFTLVGPVLARWGLSLLH